MTADETVVVLVNTSPLEARTVIVQGGAYAEHQIDTVTCYGEQTVIAGFVTKLVLCFATGALSLQASMSLVII